MGDDPLRPDVVKHSRNASGCRKVVAEQPAQAIRIVRTGHRRRNISRDERLGRKSPPPDALRLSALHHTARLALHRHGRHTHRGQRSTDPRSQCINTVQRLCPRLVHGDNRRRNAAHTPPHRDQPPTQIQNPHHIVLHSIGGQLRRYPHAAGRSPALPALSARGRLLLVHEPRPAMALHGRPADPHILFH